MFKASFRNILVYLFLKYIAFYVFMMFRTHIFYLVNPEIRSVVDLYYYLWMFLFLPVMCMLLFSAPIYFAFRLKNVVYFVLIIIAFLIAEYFMYTYSASQTNLMNGVYNGVLSILFLLLFFFKRIKLLFATDAQL